MFLLTIKAPVCVGEACQQELTGLLNRRQKVSFALPYQRFFHLTCTACVITRTETQVFTCQVEHHILHSVQSQQNMVHTIPHTDQ